MNSSTWDFFPPFYTGADDGSDPAAAAAASADASAAAASEAAAAAQALAAQQPVVTTETWVEPAPVYVPPVVETTAPTYVPPIVETTAPAYLPPIAPPYPIVRRHHVWRRRNGTTFRTRIGTPQDWHAERQAFRGHIFRVSGETFTGAPELYFTVVRPDGATLRWDDSSVQEGHKSLPFGMTFQGVLRPHDLIEVTTPGYIGWVSVYEVNQLGATKTGQGFPGDLKYRVVNPHGAALRDRDSSLMAGAMARTIPPGTIVWGTPRGDGYIVEVSSGGIAGWLNALDLEQLTSAAPAPVLKTSGEFAGAFPGELQYRVVNPHGAALRDRDSSLMAGAMARTIPPGTIVWGTPRGDGYIVEVASGGIAGWLNALDLEQLTSAAPAPVLKTSGDFAGVDGGWGAVMDHPQGCALGTWWNPQLGQCVPLIPAPPPVSAKVGWEPWEWRHHHHHEPWLASPVVEYIAGLEYVGEGGWGPVMDQPQACAQGTWWNPQLGQCVPLVPSPPPVQPLPLTLADWHRKQATSGEFTGWEPEWELRHRHHREFWPYEVVGADERERPVTGQHPNVPAHQPPAAHAEQHARDASRHAAMAQQAAEHTGHDEAHRFAQSAAEHANLSAEHARSAAMMHGRDSEGSRVHAQAAEHHARMADHHARFARGEHHGEMHRGEGQRFDDRRGGRRGGGDRGARRGMRGGRGFNRFNHAHPEWHQLGHPAWRHGVLPRWQHHRAGCARSNPVGAGIGAALLGPIGALFGAKAPCLIERVQSPEGHVSYRTTPAGEQEGVQLDQTMVSANTQYEQQSGQPAPTVDDGPMPGSDPKANGAAPPDPAPKGQAADGAADGADAGHGADAGAGDAQGTDAGAQAHDDTQPAGGADAQGEHDDDGSAADTSGATDASGAGAQASTQGYFAGWGDEDPFAQYGHYGHGDQGQGMPMMHPHHHPMFDPSTDQGMPPMQPHHHHPMFDPSMDQGMMHMHSHHHHPMDPGAGDFPPPPPASMWGQHMQHHHHQQMPFDQGGGYSQPLPTSAWAGPTSNWGHHNRGHFR